jgi:spore maturation protein CgeB
MRIIYFATYYNIYLQDFYLRNNLDGKSYNEIYNLLQKDNFGVFGQYAKNALFLGHDSIVIIANCRPLQEQWAEENDIKFDENTWEYSIPLEQVKKFKPDVFFIGSMFNYYGSFLDNIKLYCGSLMAWTACGIPEGVSFNKFSLVLTSVPNMVEMFRNKYKVNSELLLPSFDHKIFESLKDSLEKDIDFSFIGGLSTYHKERHKLIHVLASKTKIALYGYNYPPEPPLWKRMFKSYPIQKAYKGECWGMEMYKTLGRSLISFNSHIDIAENYAGNIRMFEATGMGSLLLTDYKDNLNSIFEIDKEIVAYKNIDEAIEKVHYLLANSDELKKISRAGQARTFRDYNFENSVKLMLTFFENYQKIL